MKLKVQYSPDSTVRHIEFSHVLRVKSHCAYSDPSLHHIVLGTELPGPASRGADRRVIAQCRAGDPARENPDPRAYRVLLELIDDRYGAVEKAEFKPQPQTCTTQHLITPKISAALSLSRLILILRLLFDSPSSPSLHLLSPSSYRCKRIDEQAKKKTKEKVAIACLSKLHYPLLTFASPSSTHFIVGQTLLSLIFDFTFQHPRLVNPIPTIFVPFILPQPEMSSFAFVPAVRLPISLSPSLSRSPLSAGPLHSARWRMSASPDPNRPPSSLSDTSTPSAGDYSIDTDALMERAKEVASDVSERPFYYSKIVGYGVGAIVILTVLRAIVSAIDSLPVLPATLELIGLGYASWFVWRYVLFRESRAELLEEIEDFLGRTRPNSD